MSQLSIQVTKYDSKLWLHAPVKFFEHLKAISNYLVILFVFSKKSRSEVSSNILVASHNKTLI